jgi:hypothetical protein
MNAGCATDLRNYYPAPVLQFWNSATNQPRTAENAVQFFFNRKFVT